MSTAARKKPQADPSVVESVSRKPQQGRSKASLERMLSAAEKLMLERGSEDFTLQEVSQKGSVSIGSIYLRFDGKDNLVRAVIADHLERMEAEEDVLLADVGRSKSLGEFVTRFVEGYAELLRHHAPLLRMTMQRASQDSSVSVVGKRSALRFEKLSTEALLAYPKDIGGQNREVKANSSFHVIFATLARQLSLGSTDESAQDYDWEQLKRELARMCLAYLFSTD